MPNINLTRPVLAALLGSAALFLPSSSFAQATPPAVPVPAAPAPASPPAAKPAAPPPAAPAPTADDEREKARSAYKAYFDAKLAALHAGLELTAAQAPLWPPVEQAIRALAQGQMKAMHGGGEPGGSPLEKLEKRADYLDQRAKDLKALTEATAPLVQSLDANQKEHLPKLLDGAFKGRKVLYAAFNVETPRQDEGGPDERGPDERGPDKGGPDEGGRFRPEGRGQDGAREVDRHGAPQGWDHDGPECDGPERDRRDRDSDGGHDHEWRHSQNHHHHPRWDRDGSEGEDGWRHEDHDGGEWHHRMGQNGDRT